MQALKIEAEKRVQKEREKWEKKIKEKEGQIAKLKDTVKSLKVMVKDEKAAHEKTKKDLEGILKGEPSKLHSALRTPHSAHRTERTCSSTRMWDVGSSATHFFTPLTTERDATIKKQEKMIADRDGSIASLMAEREKLQEQLVSP